MSKIKLVRLNYKRLIKLNSEYNFKFIICFFLMIIKIINDLIEII
jgi:hypothetical protein